MQMYKTGYITYNLKNFITYEEIKILQMCRSKCERLIVGVPSDEFFLRMSNREPELSFQGKKEMLMALREVDDVISVDTDNIVKTESHKQIQYDVCFYGTEYGKHFWEDRSYLEKKEVAMFPVFSDEFVGGAAFKEALDNAAPGREVILFGTGEYFDYYMQNYSQEYPPAYAVDIVEETWDTQKEGIEIKKPDLLKDEDPDHVFIVLCCENYRSVLEQYPFLENYNYRSFQNFDTVGLLDEYAVTWLDQQAYLDHIQNILLKILIEFIGVCEKYDLKYYINAGSIIGAVRHHDFIPWDDDLDVAMPRKDYEILKSKADELWKDSDYMLVGYDDLGKNVFSDFIPRLLYMKEEVPNGIYQKVAGKARPEIFNKTGVDIFILEKASNAEWRHRLATIMIKGVYALAMGHRAFVDYTDYDRVSSFTRFLIRIVNLVGSMIPLKILFKMFEKISAYADKEDCDYYFESNGPIPNWMPVRFQRSFYGEGLDTDMCGITVKIPEDYDGLLRKKGYGDYMQFPPVNCRKPGHSAKRKGVIW